MFRTPDEFRNATLGKAIDMDGYPVPNKNQCWDLYDYFLVQNAIPVSAYCSLTGYVCDLWRLKDKYEYYKYFDYITDAKDLQPGDWCFWDRGSSHNSSHVAMYMLDPQTGNPVELGQNQGYPYVTEKTTTWDIMGALRWKGWNKVDIPFGASIKTVGENTYSLYRQNPATETFAVLSAGLNKVAPISKLDADVYVMGKAAGANFFQMREGQPDPVNTTYGDISSPLNDVWRQLPNQDSTLYFDMETGMYGDCTGISIDPKHNVFSPSVVFPETGNFQYATMVKIEYVNHVSRYSFVIRLKDGTYILGLAMQDSTPKKISDDIKSIMPFDSISFLDGGGSAQFGRWDSAKAKFEYIRDTGRAIPSAVAIIGKAPLSAQPTIPESKPSEDETGESEEEPMPSEKPVESPEIEPVENWEDPEPKTNIIVDRIAALLSVKSIITIFLTIIFGLLVLKGEELPDKFVSIYTMCISFFFGYQFKKAEGGGDK